MNCIISKPDEAGAGLPAVPPAPERGPGSGPDRGQDGGREMFLDTAFSSRYPSQCTLHTMYISG
ncbi:MULTISPECIES: hypothetical protein [Cupriavidus]